MKAFTIIIVVMLLISGITTLVSFHMLINGISDLMTYDKIRAIAVVSAIITFISIVLVGVRVVILIQRRMRHPD
ncbi:hypothetical protein [Lachnoclostridium phytofermentans]|uniref:hypothetical protein n=1 Tax=Lachnoclostridium phytofermentans TaxID=66219 RepID=UPI00059FA7CE|nr:hypothetical protein [Lachnoclostridium phytofermentans]